MAVAVHLSPAEVTALPEYRAWMAACGAGTRHVLACTAHPGAGPAMLPSSAAIHARLNVLAPAVFPLPPAPGKVDATTGALLNSPHAQCVYRDLCGGLLQLSAQAERRSSFVRCTEWSCADSHSKCAARLFSKTQDFTGCTRSATAEGAMLPAVASRTPLAAHPCSVCSLLAACRLPASLSAERAGACAQAMRRQQAGPRMPSAPATTCCGSGCARWPGRAWTQVGRRRLAVPRHVCRALCADALAHFWAACWMRPPPGVALASQECSVDRPSHR